ncbi:MarR family transcriptional regulator [Arthrobacter methylotrophus]|uniref:MarR family winged helix-turn-helix transcriptional regulator n=1 Tax=Arthrobacter methylotrophus TaxID=121291 RepID=A0ABV5UJQ7_9MICC
MTELMAHSFFETLHPLLRRLNTERTLSPGKIGVLRHLTEHGRATTTELAAAGHVSPQGISLAVRELDRLGLVVKIPDSEDRRRIWIELTEAGRQRLLQESSSGREWLARAINEKLTPQERTTLEAAIPVLQKLGSETLT